ncbi:MAG: Rieske 2Fe-2S domain-containing protein [Allosphingosinicella sp.]
MREEQNRLLTEIGPGTPAGRLFRQYWQPVALLAELERRNPLPVGILGEKLCLFRDGSGNTGLIDDRCAHRGTSLSAGDPHIQASGRIDRRGLRCCYHGWLYDTTGQCLDQPAEPDGGFAHKIKISAYPIQHFGGMIWAFLGTGEPPVLPPLDVLVREDGHRLLTIGEWPCNYFQVAENCVDPVHVSVLHIETDFDDPFRVIPELDAVETPLGLKTIAGRPGYTREVEFLLPACVRLAVPIMKPSIELAFWMVPVDDVTTRSLHAWFIPFAEDTGNGDREAAIERFHRFLYEGGRDDPLRHTTKINAQDKFATASQGQIAPRQLEHLGRSDKGVILFRKLFLEALGAVETGDDPKGVLRTDPDQTVSFPNVY